MVWADSEHCAKRCDYCHEPVSVFEGTTELGKWYHESCMIHLLFKNILKYRKKFVDGKLTLGDCVEIAEMWNLRQKMLAEKHEYKGFKPVAELHSQGKRTHIEKQLILGRDGYKKLVNVEVEDSVAKYQLIRPDVVTTVSEDPLRLIAPDQVMGLMSQILEGDIKLLEGGIEIEDRELEKPHAGGAVH